MKRPRYVYAKPNGGLFFKHPKSGKLALPDLDAPDFSAEYQRLMASVANNTLSVPVKAAHPKHMTYAGDASVGALCNAYFASAEFAKLGRRGAHVRRLYVEQSLQTMLPEPMSDGKPARLADWRIDEVTVAVCRDLRDALVYAPEKHHRPLKHGGDLTHWRDARLWAMRVVFNWGVDRPYGWIERDDRGRALGKRSMTGNPFMRVGTLYKAGEGHRVWTDDDCDQFEAWTIGEHLYVDRVGFGLARYAAVRRCDVVRLGKDHVKWVKSVETGERIRALVFKEWKGSQSKTDRRTNKERIIPIAPQLWDIIERCPGALDRPTFIVGAKGGRCSDAKYGTHFNELARIAGLPEGCTMHGIRKYVGMRMADGGATPHQIAAMLGHMDRNGEVSTKNVHVYTRKANQKKLTEAALGFVIDGERP